MAETATDQTTTPPAGSGGDPTPPAAGTTTDPPAATPPAGATDANRLAEAQRRAAKAEREAADAKQKLDELADKERTELEKAQRKADAAEAKASEAEAKAQRLERSALIRSAASAANFTDPDDAVAHLSDRIADIGDEAAAKDAVEALAKDKAHLVGKRPDPTAMGALPQGGTSPGGEPPGGPVPTSTGDPAKDAEAAKSALGTGLLQSIRQRRQNAGGLPATTGRE